LAPKKPTYSQIRVNFVIMDIFRHIFDLGIKGLGDGFCGGIRF